MIVHQVYAQIYENKVQNVIVCDNYEMANYLARACYGDDAFSVDCLQYPCGIGDTYVDGIFYRSEAETGELEEIPRKPTQEEQVERLTIMNVTLESQLTDTQLALVEQYEENLALQEEVTNTQLALCEIYERMEV